MSAPVRGTARLRVEVSGAVQGVGFRPHVYRRAASAGLAGWVVNDSGGVRLEVEGPRSELEAFLEALRTEPPPRAVIRELRHRWLEPAGFDRFSIRSSDGGGALTAAVLPDLATCPACLAEVVDPGDRRAGYAFTNCTDCGPRFTIVRDLPYDRPLTTMAGFEMCSACAAEYADPLDRRFHAQPNACPECGPRLEWRSRSEAPDAGDDVLLPDALASAAGAIGAGRIVAVKGLGGFHLVCDAGNEEAVRTLRARKRRPSRPLAIMVADLAEAERLCRVDATERALLSGPEAPIVLLERREGEAVAPSVAPGNPRLGVMLPYTPLHHLLLRAVGGPVVATSGNLSDEPICIETAEAEERLGAVADDLLVHDRPIRRPVDDSVATVLDGAPTLLRRSRGYAPLPLSIPWRAPPILAVGGHQKNTVALAREGEAWLGQHVGDLGAPESRDAFRRCVDDLLTLYRVRPEIVAHDLHPDYFTTGWALDFVARRGAGAAPVEAVAVQHHHAHLASVLAEHGRDPAAPPVLGVIWDGTGYGPDGTVWGGELLAGDAAACERAGHLHPFRLPGGEAAVREPTRVALALLLEAGLPADGLPLPDGARRNLVTMVERGVASPVTTSAGRLFDGVSALLGLRGRATFEGEPAIALEHAADPAEDGAYAVELRRSAPGAPLVMDWRPALSELVDDVARGAGPGAASARFHNALVGALVEAARSVGRETVVLSGGCFQNRILTERAAAALRRAGFAVLQNRRVPPNDGGIAFGQAAVAAARRSRSADGAGTA